MSIKLLGCKNGYISLSFCHLGATSSLEGLLDCITSTPKTNKISQFFLMTGFLKTILMLIQVITYHYHLNYTDNSVTPGVLDRHIHSDFRIVVVALNLCQSLKSYPEAHCLHYCGYIKTLKTHVSCFKKCY